MNRPKKGKASSKTETAVPKPRLGIDQDKTVDQANEISCELLRTRQIRPRPKIRKSKLGSDHDYSYFTDRGELMLEFRVKTSQGTVIAAFSLRELSTLCIDFFNQLFSSENANGVLSKSVVGQFRARGIDVLQLLNVKRKGLKAVKKEHAFQLLNGFFVHFPGLIRSSVENSFNIVAASYLRQVLGSNLKDHWKNLGLREDFSLSPASKIGDIVANSSARTKLILAGEIPLDLGSLAGWEKLLRERYKAAKKCFKCLSDGKYPAEFGFSAASLDAWENECEEIFDELHPDLLRDMKNISPKELACLHLARSFGYGPDHMRILIRNSRKTALDADEAEYGDII